MRQRRATGADIAAMWALRTRAVRHGCATHYPADTIEVWAASPVPPSYAALVAGGGAFIAEEGDLMLGYAIVDLAASEVEAVFVDPAAGGRGIGKSLLGALEQAALAHGCTRLHLSASLNAVAFYEAARFAFIRNDVYAHPSGIALPCVRMDKLLAQAG